MKIVKQKGKTNQFNIENLTIARTLAIMNALEYMQTKGLITTAGNQLLIALNNQKSVLKFNED